MRQIGRCLRYLPHSIKLKVYPGGILVSWEDNETEAFRILGPRGPDYHVVLHAGIYASAETALLHDKAGKWPSINQGTTAQPLVRPSLSKWYHMAAASSSLVRHTECASLPVCLTPIYYAMIALNEDRAFYGVPSDRLSPGLYERVENLSQ